ncbi:MAG: hypothetical protein HXX18_10135 [Bacteroidetes bacterium]|nr:hypothetical protein [Bacteroidota bacterium]
MKKLIMLTVVLFAFALTTNNLLAQTQEKTDKATVKTEQTKASPGQFTDKNNNGVCDNRETKMKTGKGANFVDKNGDGICDNKGKNCKRGGKGNGNCSGNGNGNGFQHSHGCGQGNGNGCRNAAKTE